MTTQTKEPMPASSTATFLLSYKQSIRSQLLLAVGLGLSSGLLLILQAWFLASIVNAALFEKQALSSLTMEILGLLGLIFIRTVLGWYSEQVALSASTQVQKSIRNTIHQTILDKGPAWLEHYKTGEIVTTAIDGVHALEGYYARYLPTMSLVVLIPVAILVVIFPIDWVSGLTLLITAPLIPFFMILIGKGTEKLNQKQWKKLTRMGGHFLDMVQGLTTLKLFNATRHEAQVIARITNQYRQTTMSVLKVAFLSSLILEFLATISIALVAVFIGFRLLYGEMNFFDGFFILLLAPEFYLPLRNMGANYHARLEAIGASEKIINLINTNAPSTKVKKQSAHNLSNNIQTNPLVVNNISFEYEAGRPALNNVSFIVKPKQSLAIVGASGSGKSTLIKLLLGFETLQQGNISIGQHSIHALSMKEWYQHIAWLPQHPHLFNATIKDNLTLGSTYTDQAIKEAAKMAYADEFINNLPQQYDTIIGEKGEGLSGGQRQRIALTRAFLKNAPLLILDEATSHLDPISEHKINQALIRLSQNKTVIMITHQRLTAKQADHIIVLKNGTLVEQGSHDALMKLKKEYAQHWN